jgi:hypothetical protein
MCVSWSLKKYSSPWTYRSADNSRPVSFTVRAWKWVYATNLPRLQTETSKRNVGKAHSALITAILLPQHLSCYWGKIVSLRMLTNLRFADLGLPTAQQRYTGKNLPSDLSKCLKLPWQRKLLLVGHKLLYWARNDRGLRYSVCSRICYVKHLKCKYLNMYWQSTKYCGLWLTIDRPAVSSERAPHKNTTATNIWSWEPEGARHQDRLSVVTWLWIII